MAQAKLAYNVIENNYELVAKHLLEVSKNHKLFLSSVKMDVAMFKEGLIEADQKIMHCACCNQFFKEYGSLVYVDGSTGNLVSAIWRNVEHENPVVQGFFNRIATQIESGKIIGPAEFVPAPKRMKNMILRIGNVRAGGFSHYHGKISIQDQEHVLNVRGFNSAKAGLTNLATKYKGFTKLAEGIETFSALFQGEKYVAPAHKENLAKYVSLIKHVDEFTGYGWNIPAIIANICSVPCGPKIRYALKTIEHFAGSALGRAVYDYICSDKDYEYVLKSFLKDTDVHAYKVRETENVRKKELDDARKVLEESGQVESLKRRLAKPEDIVGCWESKVSPAEPKEEVSPFDMVKCADSKKEYEKLQTESKNVQEITYGRFISEIVPNADSIAVKMPAMALYSTLDVPVDADAPAIFFWDTEEERRPWCTAMPHYNIPPSFYGFEAGQVVEVAKIAPTPWNGEHVPTQGSLSESWMMIFDGMVTNTEVIGRLESYGQILKSELQPHRRAIDAVLPYFSLDTNTENLAIYLAFGANRRLSNVRVTVAGITHWYDIVGIK